MSLPFASGGQDLAVSLLALPSLVAVLAYLVAALAGPRWAVGVRNCLLLGWLAQGCAIVIETTGLGSGTAGARFGFAPALSMTLWLVLAVYGVESRFVPLPGARRTLAWLGAVTVMLAWLFPAELRPQEAPHWAPLHWVLGFASYGLFGAAVLHAAMLSRAERRLRQHGVGAAAVRRIDTGMPLLRLERLTFRFVAVGFAVLSVALLLGAWFAHPWRWDHKTVFSVLGWLIFAGLLAGRRAFGWRGPLATRWLYAGVGLLLLAYVGTRFVLEVLLHRVVA